MRARVAAIRQLTHNVRELCFELIDPPTIAFQAGQYVAMTIHPSAAAQAGASRAYSICSSPQGQKTFHLVANLVPGGEGSHYFFGLQVGDEVRLRGPTGHFVLDERTTRDYYFIATGTGIAPIRAMVLDQCARGITRSMTLLWGLRSEQDIYYQDEWTALAKRHPQFRFHLTLSQPQGAWRGLTGRVTVVLPDLLSSVNNLDVYLCGSQAMIHEVKTMVKTKGLCPIHTEKFY